MPESPESEEGVEKSRDEVVSTSKAERLASIRKKLADGRNQNLKAVEEDARQRQPRDTGRHNGDDEDDGGDSHGRTHRRTRKRPKRNRDENDVMSNAMYRRFERVRRAAPRGGILPEPGSNNGAIPGPARGAEADVVVYGGKGTLENGAAERAVDELLDVEVRKEIARKKQKTFNEDEDEIGFINESNRKFNSMVDKHYDKFDSVREVKESLERGTALP